MAVDQVVTRTEAGVHVPVKESTEILQGMIGQSAILQLARRTPMSTKSEKTRVLSALPEAYWVDGDTGLKQTTKAAWDSVTMVAEELAVIVVIPDNLVADADIDLWAEMRPLIVEAFGVKLDEACLFGTDAPDSFNDAIVPDAIAKGNALQRGDLGSLDLDIGDEDGLMALVEEDGFEVTGFAARTRMKAALRGMRDANGLPSFIPSVQAGTPSSFYGQQIQFPVSNGVFNANGIDIIAGDWSKAVVGVRQDLTYKRFTEGVISDEAGNVVLNLMQQDSQALRIVARYGFRVANPFNRFNADAEDPYPFAVLQSRSAS